MRNSVGLALPYNFPSLDPLVMWLFVDCPIRPKALCVLSMRTWTDLSRQRVPFPIFYWLYTTTLVGPSASWHLHGGINATGSSNVQCAVIHSNQISPVRRRELIVDWLFWVPVICMVFQNRLLCSQHKVWKEWLIGTDYWLITLQ